MSKIEVVLQETLIPEDKKEFIITCINRAMNQHLPLLYVLAFYKVSKSLESSLHYFYEKPENEKFQKIIQDFPEAEQIYFINIKEERVTKIK